LKEPVTEQESELVKLIPEFDPSTLLLMMPAPKLTSGETPKAKQKPRTIKMDMELTQWYFSGLITDYDRTPIPKKCEMHF